MADPVRLQPLPPEEAIRFFRSKGLASSFAWQDVWQEEHARAFTVAKAMERAVLEDIRAALDDALANGTTFETFKAELRPQLEARGWWGRREMTDPLTGVASEVQLGSPRRLKTIFDMNLRTAYAAGRWERIEESKALLPYLVFTTVGDSRVRLEHRAWDGVCLPVDDPWWATHYPPCGWGCRCTTIQVSARTAERRGLKIGETPPRFPPRPYTNPRTGEVTVIEGGITPGFSYNVGQAYLRGQSPTLIGPDAEVSNATAVTRSTAIAAFLAGFGSEAGANDNAKEKDRVWLDRDGYPQVVGPGLFAGAGGRELPLSTDQLLQLAAVGRVLREPVSTSWVWVRRGEAAPVLLKRYRRDGLVVDMASGGGSPAWRFQSAA
ncbi:minor capsid protein [Brevundimonas vitis]|uniref:Minor capsid protein n=1 Tax=Brevundimonas vitisensis TaxID=2800818 RepID=A0ABX7BTP8_9CAUL|nr:phage minor head protein [Brevundimonas vitisensis]QQQ19681.1 minor capsid protein [Brevundimonas vitisensis]